MAKLARDRKSNPGGDGAYPGGAGVSGSVPVDEVIGHQVAVISDLSRDYLLMASWGPRPVTPAHEMLPPVGKDGKLAWRLPTYEVNEFGLTVGHDGITMDTPRSAYPDLLSTNFRGRTEYIRTDEVYASGQSGTPGEARRQQERLRRRGLVDENGDSCHFLYEADGRTRVARYCPARENRLARREEARRKASARPER